MMKGAYLPPERGGFFLQLDFSKRALEGSLQAFWGGLYCAEGGGGRRADLGPWGKLQSDPSGIRSYEGAGGGAVFEAPDLKKLIVYVNCKVWNM